MEKIRNAKSTDIVNYMENLGFTFKKRGSLMYCSSPFSSDSNPSFVVYPNNRYWCFSTGRGGDIINLVKDIKEQNGQLLTFSEAVDILNNEEYIEFRKKRIFKKYEKNEFIIPYTYNEEYREIINNYARSRGIVDNYECGVFYNYHTKATIPCIMFPHKDENLNICGAKLRNAEGDEPRYRATGKLCYYIIEDFYLNSYQEPYLYMSESETSSNSLHRYLKELLINHVILSVGGVSNIPRSIPKKYRSIKHKFLIIDYDGSEEMYKERISKYEPLNLIPKKIILPKGEDINTLYCTNQINTIKNIILN